MTPKPTDYKAEAREWLRRWELRFEHYGIDLAALLERLCGEAMKEEQSLHALAQQEWEAPKLYGGFLKYHGEEFGSVEALRFNLGRVETLEAQLAEAQKEIERLKARRPGNYCPRCGVEGSAYDIAHIKACHQDAINQGLIAMEARALKAESSIEQAREEGFRQCDGQWQMAVGFAVTGMEREKVIAQVRDEGRLEQREKDAQLMDKYEGAVLFTADGERTMTRGEAIREAKP